MVDLLKLFLKYVFYFFSSFIALTLLFVAYLIWFQPPFYFPKPTGQYAVGVKDYHWVDTNRKETFADDPAHPNRELMVKIWFPTSLFELRRTVPSSLWRVLQGGKQSYDGTGPASSKLSEKPTTQWAPEIVNHLKAHWRLFWLFVCSRPIYTYAQNNASIVSNRVPFPIVIFSHGHGTCNQNSSTAQCEELASHGYVVVSINHTHGSIITEFSDGRTVGIQSAKKNDTGTNFTQKKEFLDSVLEVWISDIQFVLDQLKNITQDKESCFYGRLDMKNIGMFGHSLGGATAAQVCRRDNRVKAGVDLDGGLFGPTPAANFNKPFMFLINPGMFKNVDQPLPEEIRRDFKITSHGEEDAFKYVTCFSIEQLIKVLGPDAYTFVIKGMGHLDFTDIGLFKNSSFFFKFFRNLGSKSIIGSIDGFRATEIVNAYLVNFFDKYLKAQQSELLDGGGKQYPEVEMKLCHKL